MSELKTKPNDKDVNKFLNNIVDVKKREDSFEILKIMKNITGIDPKMWGDSIVGFGSYHYKYSSGREGDWFLVGFSPRKQNLTLYIMSGFEQYEEILSKLGKVKIGKSCLYIKNLDQIDKEALRDLIRLSVKYMEERYKS